MESNFYLKEEEIINKEYYNEFKTETSMLCPICKNILIEPQICSTCQISFCKECINLWKTKNDECPSHCKTYNITTNRLLNKILEKLKFKCRNGCDAEFTYLKALDHYSKECTKIGLVSNLELGVIKKDVVELKATIETQNKEIEKLKERIASSQSVIQALADENEEIKKSIEELKKENQEMKNELEKLKSAKDIKALCKKCFDLLEENQKSKYRKENVEKIEVYVIKEFNGNLKEDVLKIAKCEKCQNSFIDKNEKVDNSGNAENVGNSGNTGKNDNSDNNQINNKKT